MAGPRPIVKKNLPYSSKSVKIIIMIFDIHVHTNLSPCSQMAVEDAIIRAKECGLDGICITDHDTMDVRHILSEGFQENGLCVVFGMEYSTSQGDFLVFGPFENLQPRLTADLLLQIVDQSGGIAVAAHPFRKQRPVSEHIIKKGWCRTIECINGRNTPAENLEVEKWRQCYELTECGGSDAHSVEEVGTFATHFFVSIRTRVDLIRALKQRMCQAKIHDAKQMQLLSCFR
jgi:predicted metal-dependent phosphoesterase TrpH